MRGRWPLLVLLAGALMLLASLYLPWRTPQNAHGSLDGWDAAPGYAAGLLALGLAVATGLAFLRPSYAKRLPLGGLGVSLAFFAAGVAVQLTEFSIPVGTYPGPGGWTAYGPIHWGWSYGVYLGGTGGGLAGLAALVLRREELLYRRRAVAEDAAALLALGLLASFLLPWQKSAGSGGIAVIGLVGAAAMIAAAGVFLGAGRLAQEEPGLRLACAAAVAVLTGAAASGLGLSSPHAYGAWIGVGCAVALVALGALEVARARPKLAHPEAPGRVAALRSGAAALLLVALFLPWVSFDLGHGRTFTTDGWQQVTGASGGFLALLLLAAPALPSVATYTMEATLGVVVLVATFGIDVAWEANFPALGIGYGSYAGFAAAGLVLFAELGHIRWPTVDRRRAIVRAVPVLASLACIGSAVVPAWQGVLPLDWTGEADAVRSWFSIAALLLALHLLRLWIGRIAFAWAPSRRLVIVPLLILPLPVLELVLERSFGIVWGGLILVCLCLLLAALGLLERRGGLENFRLPELLRIDRLPETER